MMKIKWWHIVLLVALFLAVLSPIASSFPDGLERVAEDAGFVESAQEAHFKVIPDYALPGIENEASATILAGVIGTLVVFVLGYGLASLLKRKHET